MAKDVMLRGHLDEHRAGGRRTRYAAGAPDGGVKVGAAFDQELRFGDGTGDGHLIDGMKLKRFAGIAPDAAGQYQHGDVIEISLGDSRERMRQSGAGNHVSHRQFSGGAVNAIGHE